MLNQEAFSRAIERDGRLRELATTDNLVAAPQDDHTQQLMRLMERLDMLSRMGLQVL